MFSAVLSYTIFVKYPFYKFLLYTLWLVFSFHFYNDTFTQIPDAIQCKPQNSYKTL